MGLWVNDSTSTNESGFSALPAGDRDEKFARLWFGFLLGYNPGELLEHLRDMLVDYRNFGRLLLSTLSNEVQLRLVTSRNRGLSVRR
ncbi:MAG: hypothetical protein IPN46_12555 [Saprospiraceae bacterium]|nr:hypothetical protein [Saprospiraceae bacterium]